MHGVRAPLRAGGFASLKLVDLRSDTVTRPTPEMYEAMVKAPLGDDVFGDDPTLQELEQLSADITGFEAAMFVPSGTMGNQIALATHTQPGDCALFDEDAHMLYYEVGAPAVIAGVVTRTCPAHRGVMDPAEVEQRIQVTSLHTPGTTFFSVENTHNRAGGAVIPLEVLTAYRTIAEKHGMKLHMDGARVFNAATALGVDIKEITVGFDSVNFCLSKALGAPVGSVLCGSQEFIDRARRWRKRLGGGMRQVGVLAACGLVGLRSIRFQLHHDHRRAREFAEGIADLPGFSVDLESQATNFVMLDTVNPASEVVARFKEEGVLTVAFGPNRVRFVFHYDVNDSDLQFALESAKRVAS